MHHEAQIIDNCIKDMDSRWHCMALVEPKTVYLTALAVPKAPILVGTGYAKTWIVAGTSCTKDILHGTDCTEGMHTGWHWLYRSP